LHELNSTSATFLVAKKTRCLPGLRLYKRWSFPEGVDKAKRNLYEWKTSKSACFVFAPGRLFCRSCHTNKDDVSNPLGAKGLSGSDEISASRLQGTGREQRRKAMAQARERWWRVEERHLMLELITTYTHAPSCRNWTGIRTELDSATLAVAQPNGPSRNP